MILKNWPLHRMAMLGCTGWHFWTPLPQSSEPCTRKRVIWPEKWKRNSSKVGNLAKHTLMLWENKMWKKNQTKCMQPQQHIQKLLWFFSVSRKSREYTFSVLVLERWRQMSFFAGTIIHCMKKRTRAKATASSARKFSFHLNSSCTEDRRKFRYAEISILEL